MRKTDNKILSASVRLIAESILKDSEVLGVDASIHYCALMEAADRIDELALTICKEEVTIGLNDEINSEE